MALSSTSWALEQARIEDLISKSQDKPDADDLQVFKLRRRRNMLTPLFSQLPPELLCYILSFHILSEKSHDDSNWYQWVVVTHVSSYLRDVAQAEPSLWTRIYVPARNCLIQQFLRRSKSLHLDIRFGSRMRSVSHILGTTFSNNLSRIKSIHLPTSFTAAEWELYFPLLTSLRCISLRFSPTCSPDLVPPCFPAHVKFDTLAIELDRCSFSWTPKLFNPKMTSLAITQATSPVAIYQLCSALSTLPRLQKLRLFNTLTDTGEPEPRSKVMLPQLQELSLKDDQSLSLLVDLLGFLSFPPSASINISNDGGVSGHLQTQDSEASARLFLTLMEHFSQPPATSSLHPPQPRLSTMLLFHRTKSGRFQLSIGQDWLNVTLRGASANIRTSSALLSLIQKLPLEHLVDLHLCGSKDSLCTSVMLHLLSCAPSYIERLRISGTLMDSFLSHVSNIIAKAQTPADIDDYSQSPTPKSMLDIITTNHSSKELILSFPRQDFIRAMGQFSPSIFVPTLSLTLYMLSPSVVGRMSILVHDHDVRVTNDWSCCL